LLALFFSLFLWFSCIFHCEAFFSENEKVKNYWKRSSSENKFWTKR
jgi:hypothetical protein